MGHYERLIPKNVWRKCIASKHRFEVTNPWWQPFEIVRLKSGELKRIEPSAYCELLVGDGYVPLLIPVSTYPDIAETITKLAEISTGGRSGKYLALYKVYEGISSQPQIRFAALRHALAHATKVLNRPKTIATLVSMFGSARVDLSLSRHQRILWHTMAELLVEVDRLVALELRTLADVAMSETIARPLTIWVAKYHFPDQLARLLSENRTSK